MKGHGVNCGLKTGPGNRSTGSSVACRNTQARSCECCGETTGLRKRTTPLDGYRCSYCRNDKRLNRLVRASLPILQANEANLLGSETHRLSAGQFRQLFAEHPGLHNLKRAGIQIVVARAVRRLLEAGGVETEIAKECGLSLFHLRILLKGHPELRHLADLNHIKNHLDRMRPVFELVEQEGTSIWAACRMLGISCNRSIYMIAGTTLALELYPKLEVALAKKEGRSMSIHPGHGASCPLAIA